MSPLLQPLANVKGMPRLYTKVVAFLNMDDLCINAVDSNMAKSDKNCMLACVKRLKEMTNLRSVFTFE